MSLSYDLYLTANQITYLDIPVTPVPASASTLTATYTSIAGSNLGSDTASSFSLNSDGIRWTPKSSLMTTANSGMTYQLKDGSTVIVSGTIHIPVVQSGGGTGMPENPLAVTHGGTGGTDAASGRTGLGLGTVATHNSTEYFLVTNNLSEGTAATMRSSLGLGAAALLADPITVAHGGTGVATLTGIVKASGTSNFVAATAETDYTTPTGTGTMSGKRITKRTSALTDASPVTINTDNADDFTLLMTAAVGATRALGTPSGSPNQGDEFILTVTQSSTGSNALTYPTGSSKTFLFSTDLPAPTLSTANNAVDVLKFRYNSTKDRWLFVGIIRGF